MTNDYGFSGSSWFEQPKRVPRYPVGAKVLWLQTDGGGGGAGRAMSTKTARWARVVEVRPRSFVIDVLEHRWEAPDERRDEGCFNEIVVRRTTVRPQSLAWGPFDPRGPVVR